MTNKQVKNELYTNKNSTWTFKNIQLRKFTTGVYDYSLFSSVFTPIDLKTFPQSLKVTATSQEWCGTIFTQLNFKDSRFNVEQRSYFEREGDVNYTTEEAFIEEEIFTVLRMNSQLLTTGNFTMIPSLNFNQLKHLKTKSVNVKAAIWTYKESEFQGEKLNEYRVVFPDLKRKIRIIF